MVMVVTVVVSLLAGLAFRRKFVGATALFYLSVASLVVPSIIISLGIGVSVPASSVCSRPGTRPAFGAHLTWTLPFGVLIMFASSTASRRLTKRPRATSEQPRGRPFGMSSCR